MVLKRCEHGHFYNGDKYQQCPRCVSKGIRSAEPVTAAMVKPAAAAAPPAMEEPMTMPLQAGSKEPVTVPLQAAAGKAAQPKNDDEKTVSFYQSKTGIEPVAGWLVCVAGDDFGRSFTIKSGRNFIGRAQSMDIVIHGDSSISREKHAVILYEPKRREFIAQAGESRELFYLNDEVVLNPARLKAHDVLTVGNTSLMFFPCCSEDFSWDDFK